MLPYKVEFLVKVLCLQCLFFFFSTVIMQTRMKGLPVAVAVR